MVVKPSSLTSSFIASALVHFVGFALAVGLLTQQSYRREGNPIPVSLLESVLEEKPSESVEQKISRAAVKRAAAGARETRDRAPGKLFFAGENRTEQR